jgi:hypothetical protein
VRHKEDAVSKAAEQALQHPVLLGPAVSVLLLAFTLASALQMRVVSLYYPLEIIGNISIAKSAASCKRRTQLKSGPLLTPIQAGDSSVDSLSGR